GHARLDELGNAGMPQQMRVEGLEMPALGVIDQQLLDAVHGERLTTGTAFQRDKDVRLLWHQIASLVVEIAIERFEGECVDVDRTRMSAFSATNVDRVMTALDVVKLDGKRLTDA